MVPNKRLTKTEFDLLLVDDLFLEQLVLYQEKYFLNLDIEQFSILAKKTIIDQTDNTINCIYLAPGDSPSKFVDFYRYLVPEVKIIDFPLSGLGNTNKIDFQNLTKYISYYLNGITRQDLSRLCLIDYVVTGTTRNRLEKVISQIYKIGFKFKQVLNLRQHINLQSIGDSEGTLTRAVIGYPINEIKTLKTNIVDRQIKGHNIFMLLVLCYYKYPEKYLCFTVNRYQIIEDLTDSNTMIQIENLFPSDNVSISLKEIVYLENYEIKKRKDLQVKKDCSDLIIENSRINLSQIISLRNN